MKLDFDSFREVGDALVRNRSRSILTGFGIFWGIFMLLALSGGGSGLKTMLTANFEGFASNALLCGSSQTSRPWGGFKEGRDWKMDINDIERLKMMVPELDVVTPMWGTWGQTATLGVNTENCNLKAVMADYAKVETPNLLYGRFINESDIIQERKVCVIGKRIYNSLFPQGGDPCGKMIHVGAVYYTIVGVDVSSGNINIGGTADKAVIIPYSVAGKIYHFGNSVYFMLMTGRKGVTMSSIEPRVRQVIARRHTFDPNDRQALFVMNTEELFHIMDNLMDGIDFLIWLVGLGTILAGAIGVSNIMMVTVKERTTEIGIRRAIGATPSEILTQIIAESITLTLIAGSAGIVLSVWVLNIVEKASGNPSFAISFWSAVLAALLLALLGAVAGLAPALRAMKIKPVDAMRDE